MAVTTTAQKPAPRKGSAHSLNRLTDTIIKAAIKERQAIGTGATLLGDGGGLTLRIDDAGIRWKLRYRKADGRRGELGLGSYPAVSLLAARTHAKRERDASADGADLVEAKRESRARAKATAAIPTFGVAADSFIRDKVKPRSTNDKHLYQWGQTLGEAYCASIRGKRVDRITTDDVLGILLQTVTRTPRYAETPVTGPLWTVMPDTASRLADRIKRVLDYATVEGHRKGDNPARWVGHLEHKLVRVVRRDNHQASMHYGAVPQFTRALRERNATAGKALEFLILTACRSSEVRDAVWSEFSLGGEKPVWTIPAARMKNRIEHRVPLTPRMVAILKHQASTSDGGDFVFPGAKKGRPLSNMTFKALMDRMKVTDVTAHGFRSSFRDWAGDEYGASDDIAEAALAHSWGSKVKRTYRRDPSFDRRRDLMLAWEAHCLEARSADNVVRLQA